MQQLMNQIQQLMQELQKDQAIQMTEQFQNKSEDMKKKWIACWSCLSN